jgi:hypothetical protein
MAGGAGGGGGSSAFGATARNAVAGLDTTGVPSVAITYATAKCKKKKHKNRALAAKKKCKKHKR